MTARDDAIARLEERYRAFRSKLAAIPQSAYPEVRLGDWDLPQLLAHMAGWFREMAGAFDRVGRGERPAPEGVDYADPEPWNARFAAAPKPAGEALADLDDAYATYRGAALRLDESLYGTDPERGRPRIGERLLQGAGTGHLDEHLPDLDRWSARGG